MTGWRESAACRGMDTQTFIFDAPLYAAGSSEVLKRYTAKVDAAKKVCARCPVRDRCLEDVLGDSRVIGVFGGTTKAERRKIRLRRRGAA